MVFNMVLLAAADDTFSPATKVVVSVVTSAILAGGPLVWKKLVVPYFVQPLSVFSQVAKEFSPNGGMSVKDQITRIERKVDVLAESQKSMSEHQKKMAARHARNEQRLRVIMNNSLEAVFESDASGSCVGVNSAYCRMIGIRDDDALGWNWQNLIHYEDRPMVMTDWLDAVSRKRTFDHVYRFVRPDGYEIRVKCQAHVLTDEDGNVSGWLGVIKPFGNPQPSS
jgi:PAS domain S-box-containing protein